MKSFIKYTIVSCLAAFFLIAAPQTLKATHIVGGEMTYRLLNVTNDSFTIELKLSVYRDCFFGNPEVYFDDPAYIAAYDQFNLLRKTILMQPMNDDTLTNLLPEECLVNLTPVCVHTTTYLDTLTMPRLAGGYTFSYQRCCRNQTINNIINPLETGSTYFIRLTDVALERENNAPDFIQWPAIYICADRPLNFDHSAIDDDNDSLVYKLYTPFQGATFSVPQPTPPDPPPYDTIVWAPGYTAADMLGSTGGGEELAIDPNTGLVTALPTLVGQYVVGILVEEYDRNTGELLSIIRRDFQYNVNPCGEITSAFFAPEAQCDDLTVTFENLSENATTYNWYFDWPNNTLTSNTTSAEFDFTFPSVGTYTVTLISEPNTSCADTFSRNIFLQDNSLSADFELTAYDCDNFSVLNLLDVSIDNVSPPDQWLWTVEYPGMTQTDTLESPTFEVPLSTTGTITLQVTSRNGCVDTFTAPFTSGSDNPGDFVIPNIDGCIGQTVGLNPNTPADAPFNFSWSGPGLTSNDLNPMITVTENQIYTVTITPLNPLCEIIRVVTVNALQNPVPSFTTDLDCDGLTINFTNTSLNGTDYTWDFGDAGSPSNTSTEVDPSHTYSALGTYTVTLTASNNGVCEFSTQQDVVINMIQLEADFSAAYTNCDNASVIVQFTDESVNDNPDDSINGWLWNFGTLGTSNAQNPSVEVTADITTDVTLCIFTEDGCTTCTTQQITVQLGPDTNQFPEAFLACPGDSTQIMPGGDPAFVYNWSPTTGIDDPTSPAPTFYPTETTEYTVTVMAIGVDTCTVTETMMVNVPPALNLSVSGGGVVCTETATLAADFDGLAIVQWCDVDGNLLHNGPSFTVPVSGDTIYVIKATDGNGCQETVDVPVSGGPIDFSTPDTVAVCLGDEVILTVTNLDDNDMLTYEWTPTNLFAPGTANTNNPDYLEAVGEETVTVNLESQYGCTASQDVIVAVVDPDINLSFDFTLDCNGGTVFFTNTSTNAFGYVWDFGDDSDLNYEVSPQHTYSAAGTYPVTLSIVFDVDCVVDFTMNVTTQDPQIIADFTYDIVECSADSAVIQFMDESTNSFNNTIGWNWTFEDAVPTTSDEQNPTVTVFGSGDLVATLTILTANNCSNTTSQTINVQLVDLDIWPLDTAVVCLGDSIQLNPNGNPDYTYIWTPEVVPAGATSPFVSPDVTTTYSVTAYSVAGSDTCFVSDQVVVFIPADINLDLGADVITTCGEDVTITATADVDVAVEWTSAVDGPIGSGQTITVNPFRTDTIYATATDEFGCTATDSVIVIDNGVDITVEPGTSITACQGVDTILTIVNLDDQDILTYSWTPLSNIVGPADGASVNVLIEDLGTVVFQAIVNNQNDCADTIEVTVTVEEFQGDLPDEVFVCSGFPTPLSPDANPNYQYTWDPETGLDLTEPWNPIATLTEDQTYSITIVDPTTGCSTVDTMEVNVHPLINLETDGDTTLCRIETQTLTATADVDVSIDWYLDLNDPPFDMGAEIMVLPAVGTNVYTAIATDIVTGCMDTSIVTVIVQDQLELETTGDASICNFDATVLTATTAVPSDITWYDEEMEIGTGSPITVTPDMEGDNIYTAIAVDPTTGCMDTSMVILEVFPQIELVAMMDTALCEIVEIPLSAISTAGVAVDIEWTLNGMPVGSGADIVVTPPSAPVSEYVAIATDPITGCMDTATVTVNLQLFTNQLPTDPTIICNQESTPINPGGDPNLVYEWSPLDEHIDLDEIGPWNPVVTTDMPLTYFVTVTDTEFNCMVIDTVNIEVFEEVEVAIVGDDLILCEDGPITLTATTVNDPATIIWYELPDNNEIGTGEMIEYDPPLGTTIIYVEAISVDGCTEQDSLQIDNYPINASLPDSVIFCEPIDLTELTITNGDPAQDLTIDWNPLGVITVPPSGATVTVDPNITMDFSATVTNQFGCTETLNSTIFVIDLIGDLDIVAEPDTITLNNSSVLTVTGCDLCNYEWFENGELIEGENGPVITVTPTEPGDHEYTVTVSLLDCSETLAVGLFVFDLICDADHLFLPNAFTPNGDGNNDVVRLRTVYEEEISEMEFLIYDRWGEEIFRTTNPSEGWDGYYRGKLMAPDVYGYYLRLICPDNEELIQKGNITLLR